MRRLFALILISATLVANAQNQKIDPTVEVNRDYQGKMQEITKGRLDTTVADSLSLFKMDFNYSFFEKPYKDMYEFSAVPSAAMPKEETPRIPVFVAKAGIGYPLAPEASVWYSPVLHGNNYLNLTVCSSLYSGNRQLIAITDGKALKNGEKRKGKEYSYKVAGNYTHAWQSGELNLYGKFGGGYNTYYNGISGNGSSASHHSFNIVEGGISAKSSGAGKYGKRLNWAAKGVFRHTSDRQLTKLQENYGKFSGNFGPTFGRYNKFMVGLDLEAVQYKGNTGYCMGVFGTTPQYRYENGNLKVNLGVKLQGKFADTENVNGNHSWIFPAIDLSFRLVAEKLWLYGKADGWNSLNTCSSLLWLNRYANPALSLSGLEESSVPLHIEGGFKGRFTDKFSYRLYAAYTIHKGLLQFLYNCNGGYFLANSSSRHNETAVGGEINVATQDFRGGIEIRYSAFSKDAGSEPVTGIPALQCNLKAGYSWNGKIHAEIKCRLQGEYNFRYTGMGNPSETGYHTTVSATVPAFADLQASLEYVYSSALAFWIRGGNILNRATQYIPLYTGREAGIYGGIIVRL